MNPERVWARNFRTYPTLDWTPAVGLTTIIGRNQLGDGADSNGAGKSTLLEALFVALFGPPLPWDQYLTKGAEETVCEVGLEFEHGGEHYRVRRQYDAKGRGKSTLDFDELVGRRLTRDNGDYVPDWDPLTRGDQRETQALIAATVGLSEATFTHSVFAAQGHRHFADPSLPPRERKDILADALGLDVWERLKELVTADVRELQASLDGITQRLGAFEEDLAAKPELEDARGVLVAFAAENAEALAAAEAAEARMRDEHEAAKEARALWVTLNAQHDVARQRLESMVEKATAAAEAVARTEAEHAEIERLTPLAVQLESLELEVRRIATADLERAAAIDRKAQIDRDDALLAARAAEAAEASEDARREARERREAGSKQTCPTCEQPLHGSALDKARATAEREAGRHDERADKLAEQVRSLTAERAAKQAEAETLVIPDEIPIGQSAAAHERLQQAREASSQISGHRARLETFAAAIAAGASDKFKAARAVAQTAANLAESAVRTAVMPQESELVLLARAVQYANANTVAARAADRDAHAALAANEGRLKSIAALEGRTQEALADRARLTDRLDVLKALERSYGRDGIPALILEVQAIPQIEAESRRVIEALGMPFRVELATQRENKGGGIRDTCDVVVHEPAGARSYATYSGGERTRLEVALRLGIARLIAQRSSSHCSLFALDELPWLDRSGQAALVEVLRGLTEFEKIVVVSHEEGLADAFDQAVVVVRDEGGSRIEAAA
jgi:DNA repair exonuclease SbcCD ATPase subunit